MDRAKSLYRSSGMLHFIRVKVNDAQHANGVQAIINLINKAYGKVSTQTDGRMI